LVEFHRLEAGGIFLGTVDLDERNQWRFMRPELRPERPFEPS
jgi:hypothetical protein